MQKKVSENTDFNVKNKESEKLIVPTFRFLSIGECVKSVRPGIRCELRVPGSHTLLATVL